MNKKSRVTILVKAYPQPSSRYSETVCCAGVDENRTWKRLYPIRFRQLEGNQAFKRWDIVDFEYGKPKNDSRIESCHVHEESITTFGKITKPQHKSHLMDSVLQSGEAEAISKGQSLTLIEPRNVQLIHRRRSTSEIADIEAKYASQTKQMTFFDKELSVLKACPFEFRFKYNDGDGSHNKRCEDWETSAAYEKFAKSYGEKQALQNLQDIYCNNYVRDGVFFALGNMASRPQTWMLLGVIRANRTSQSSLDI